MNKKQKKVENIMIIVSSLALAFVINVFTWTWALNATLKASLIDKTQTEVNVSDIYLDKDSDTSEVVKLKTGTKIADVSGLSFSLIYNPKDIEIKDIYSPEKKVEIKKTDSGNGIATVYLTLIESRTIDKFEDIIWIITEKKVEKEVSISLLNANFQDKKDNKLYELTTKWIQY